MEPKQFCIKKTKEEMDKEMKETTKREMQKLNDKLKEISLPDSYSSSDGESLDYSDDDYESESLLLYKKKMEIKKLEEKKHFTNLEISNLTVENTELNENNKKLIEDIKKLNDMISTLIKIKEIKSTDNDIDNIEIYHKYTNVEMAASELVKLEKSFDTIKLNIDSLFDEIKVNFGEKQFVLSETAKIELFDFSRKITEKYNLKKKIYLNYIVEQKTNYTYLIALSGIIVSYLIYNIVFQR